MIARRKDWIRTWRDLADLGRVARDQAEREVVALLDDIEELWRRCTPRGETDAAE
jgi:hypothetical protein